jgi:hypothetical protein
VLIINYLHECIIQQWRHCPPQAFNSALAATTVTARIFSVVLIVGFPLTWHGMSGVTSNRSWYLELLRCFFAVGLVAPDSFWGHETPP